MDFNSLHELLRTTYNEMIPLSSQLTGVAKGIAGLGALFYIAMRVWASLARAETIDVYPLLRPFALGLCILFFSPLVLGSINAVLSPIVKGTEQMVKQQNSEVQTLKQKRDDLQYEALLRNPETAYLADQAKWDEKIEEMGIIGVSDAVTIAGMYAERAAYNTKKWMMEKVYELLELLYQAAGLVIDTVRTFFLIVLSILGPIVFAIGMWDGLGGSITAWFSRYISVYLWLPVSSILTALLTKIQVLMLQKDIAMLEDPNFIADGSNWYYIVFFLIGIVGYFTVPTIAGWIIEAGGGMGNYSKNLSEQAKHAGNKAVTGGKATAAAGGAVAGNVAGRIRGMLKKR